MKKLNVLFLFFFISISLFSCKDDEGEEVNPIEIPEEFSELSDEENKKNIEDNGIELVNEMEDLKSSNAIEASIAFSHFLEINSPDINARNGRSATSYYGLLQNLSLFGKDKADAKVIFETMRSKADDDPETIQEAFDEATGTYSWNSTSQAWDYEAGGDKIIFQFPSTEEGTSNNAVYTIHSYTGTIPAENPFDPDYTGDLPTGVMVDLSVDGTTVLEYRFSATYGNDGVPTSYEVSLSILPFTLKTTFTNNSEEVSIKYGLTHRDRILWDMGIGAKGDFSDITGSKNAEEMLSSGFAYFQLMDIKLAGEVNVKAISDDYANIYANQGVDFDEDAAVEKVVVSLNENVNLVLFYVEDNTKIAEAEFYATDEEGYDYVYDPETGSYEYKEYTYKVENIRLVFHDGSKSDLETYFSGSFDELQTELNALVEDL